MATYDAAGTFRTAHAPLGVVHWLAHVRFSRVIIGLLLVVLIIVPLVAHHYLSKVAQEGSGEEVRHSRLKLEAVEDGAGALGRSSDLRLRVDELLRIKTSVGNELRDLESRRQKLQSEIGLYNQKIDELKTDVTRQQQELERLKLSVEQAKYAQKEAIEKNTPDLKAPKRILPSLEDTIMLVPPSLSHVTHCRMHSCFDYSRCALTSGFPVYFYGPEEDTVLPLPSPAVRKALTHALGVNAHVTFDPHIACVFVVLLGDDVISANPSNTSQGNDDSKNRGMLGDHLQRLPHWQGDGRNHVLVCLGSGPRGCASHLYGVNTGRAIVAQPTFHQTQLRPNFDLVVPPLPPFDQQQQVPWEGLAPYSPARRKYLISFQGELMETPITASTDFKADINDENPADSGTSDPVKTSADVGDSLLVETLKNMQQSSTEDQFYFRFDCPDGKIIGEDSEWAMCVNSRVREQFLLESTFSLIISPANVSLVSTGLTQTRLLEALRAGSIPVILGDHLRLPFDEFVFWERAVVAVPKARCEELHFLVRTITDADLLALRHQGRLLWERYLSSTRAIVDTLIAAIRTRLKLAPVPSPDEPSHSVFNASFVPLKLENLLLDIDPDESVGPIEPPYSSPRFRRNFTYTVSNRFEMWNRLVDPFFLYPQMPFDPLLPSEAKFLGSGLGFRPIGHGAGGAGKEFSEALGGNVPREQFTIVMLTFEREAVLINSLQRLYGLPHLHKVVVVWNSLKPPSEDLRWPDIGVPVHVVKASKNSLNNRFLPYDTIETEAILSVDDDAHLRHDEITFGFRVWREARDRIVGFPGRYHAWDLKHGGWLYNSNYSCELSMVLTGAAFFHKYYAYVYSSMMPQAIRDKVDEYMNCEDIAMNFLVSHITRKPPLKVTSRWTFRCPGCPVALSEDDTHFQERHKCINFFVSVYGYMPLLNTQFRVDSVLFKTRLPHDKQKCFKFI